MAGDFKKILCSYCSLERERERERVGKSVMLLFLFGCD